MQMGLPTLHEKVSERPFVNKPLRWVARNPRIFSHYKGTIGWRWDIDCPALTKTALYQFFLARDPVKVLDSAVTHSDGLFTLVEKKIGVRYKHDFEQEGDKLLSRAANYWLGYVENFAKNRILLKVEEFHRGGRALDEFCEVVGIPREIKALAVPLRQRINTRAKSETYMPSSIERLQTIDPETYDRVMEERRRLGY